MNDQLKEQISAYIDDELSSDETALLLRQLAADPALRDQAEAYMAVGRDMRGEVGGAAPRMRQRVLDALHDSATVDPVDSATIAPAAGTLMASRWLRPVAGGAIAAVVAVIAINMLPGAPSGVPAPLAAETALEVTTPQDVMEPDLINYTVPATLNDSGLVGADPELAAYFLRHSVSRPSLAPGSGRARILSDVPVDEDTSEEGEASAP